ncbi:MAG TPA: hypothetical protein VIK57_07180 [Streptosporangiaceae bacterium]
MVPGPALHGPHGSVRALTGEVDQVTRGNQAASGHHVRRATAASPEPEGIAARAVRPYRAGRLSPLSRRNRLSPSPEFSRRLRGDTKEKTTRRLREETDLANRGSRETSVSPESRLIIQPPSACMDTGLDRTGLKLDEIDVFEVNEAFAAQALAVVRELGLPPERTNPNGSGISLGHPIGATGAILVVKALHELHRTGGRYALTTMCIGGGQGIVAIFERA